MRATAARRQFERFARKAGEHLLRTAIGAYFGVQIAQRVRKIKRSPTLVPRSLLAGDMARLIAGAHRNVVSR
jgi:hypothetical protein